MNYGWLRRQDLELASGNGEGAVKNVIGKRFDNGGMRWICERAEALAAPLHRTQWRLGGLPAVCP
jgi:hypothetical protein